MGLAAIVHHGMIGGLTTGVAAGALATPVTPRLSVCDGETIPSISSDPALVRLLANMVLRVHGEVRHAY